MPMLAAVSRSTPGTLIAAIALRILSATTIALSVAVSGNSTTNSSPRCARRSRWLSWP
jgi:hypothetical protein